MTLVVHQPRGRRPRQVPPSPPCRRSSAISEAMGRLDKPDNTLPPISACSPTIELIRATIGAHAFMFSGLSLARTTALSTYLSRPAAWILGRGQADHSSSTSRSSPRKSSTSWSRCSVALCLRFLPVERSQRVDPDPSRLRRGCTAISMPTKARLGATRPGRISRTRHRRARKYGVSCCAFVSQCRTIWKISETILSQCSNLALAHEQREGPEFRTPGTLPESGSAVCSTPCPPCGSKRRSVSVGDRQVTYRGRFRRNIRLEHRPREEAAIGRRSETRLELPQARQQRSKGRDYERRQGRSHWRRQWR